MLLIDYRTYVPHAFLGFLFGVDDGTVCRTNRRIEPLLAGVFRMPERTVELSRDEIRELFFDATERPTNRPGRGQRAFYSGKKKRHTIKHQVVIVRKKKTPGRGRKPRRLRIASVSKSFAGSSTTSGCTTERAWRFRRASRRAGTRRTWGRGWRRRRASRGARS